MLSHHQKSNQLNLKGRKDQPERQTDTRNIDRWTDREAKGETGLRNILSPSRGGGEGESVATIYAPQVELLCALRAYYFSRPFSLI